MKFPYQRIPFKGYDPTKPTELRPFLPVYLHGQEKSTRSPFFALLDSGSDLVLMPAHMAPHVGIDDITRGGIPVSVYGIGDQRMQAYYHTDLFIQLLGDDRKHACAVGFSEGISMPFLGRDFFRPFKAVTFKESKEQIELT